MRTILFFSFLACTAVQAQQILPPVPQDEQHPGWYIQKAGRQYNNAIVLTLLGSVSGTALLLQDDEGLRTLGGIVMGVSYGVGVGFAISGSFKLERAGLLMQSQANTTNH